MSSSPCSDHARLQPARKATRAQVVEITRRTPKGGHTVPSTLTPQMRQMVTAAVRQGRSVAQTAKDYQCTQHLVIELWLREVEREMRFGRRAA